MTKREVCYLIAGDEVVWSDAGASPIALADSRARWDAIWSRRETLSEIAHSHPIGPLQFSREDETTFAALEAALGRKMRFSIVAPGGMLVRLDGNDVHLALEPAWAAQLREDSGMERNDSMEESE